MIMTRELRRKAFRAAVAAAGYKSVKQWATTVQRHENQVYMVLSGTRHDPRTLMVVDLFILDTLLPFADQLRSVLDERPVKAPAA